MAKVNASIVSGSYMRYVVVIESPIQFMDNFHIGLGVDILRYLKINAKQAIESTNPREASFLNLLLVDDIKREDLNNPTRIVFISRASMADDVYYGSKNYKASYYLGLNKEQIDIINKTVTNWENRRHPKLFDAMLEYIYVEMMTNVNGLIYELIQFTQKHLLTFGDSYAIFAAMVKDRGPWDHKPELRRIFNMHLSVPVELYFPLPGDKENEYFYDIWSNIHYGFVGRGIFSTFVAASCCERGRDIQHTQGIQRCER